MRNQSQSRLVGIDLVKIFAIAWICVFHLLDFHSNWKLGTMFGSGDYWQYFSSLGYNYFSIFFMTLGSIGAMGVNLFIIASGVGLTLSMNHKKSSYPHFLRKRVFRIFPTYWLVLAVIGLMTFIFVGSINKFDFFVHFLAIHNFFPKYVLSISAPFWFISTIFQLYLLFPFIWNLSKKIHPIFLILIAVSLRIFVDPLLVDFFGGGRFFTEYIIDFVFGIVLGQKLFTHKPLFVFSKFLKHSLLFGLSAFVIISVDLYAYAPRILPLIFQFASALLFMMFLEIGTFISERKVLLVIHTLSGLSFLVYLTHYYFLDKFFSRIVFMMPFFLEVILFVFLSFLIAFLGDYSLKFFRKFRGFRKNMKIFYVKK